MKSGDNYQFAYLNKEKNLAEIVSRLIKKGLNGEDGIANSEWTFFTSDRSLIDHLSSPENNRLDLLISNMGYREELTKVKTFKNLRQMRPNLPIVIYSVDERSFLEHMRSIGVVYYVDSTCSGRAGAFAGEQPIADLLRTIKRILKIE